MLCFDFKVTYVAEIVKYIQLGLKILSKSDYKNIFAEWYKNLNAHFQFDVSTFYMQ